MTIRGCRFAGAIAVEWSLGHPGAIATRRCPSARVSQVRPKHKCAGLGDPGTLGVNSPASALSFAPEEHDKDHAHHSQKWRYQFHPRIPHAPPLGARECNNGVIVARSQVGLIRHADQEISVQSRPDRSSPYWVTPP